MKLSDKINTPARSLKLVSQSWRLDRPRASAVMMKTKIAKLRNFTIPSLPSTDKESTTAKDGNKE
jgi:hypothetical protein